MIYKIYSFNNLKNFKIHYKIIKFLMKIKKIRKPTLKNYKQK